MTSISTVFYKNRRAINLGLAAIVFLSVTLSPNKIRPILGNVSITIFYYFFSELQNYRYNLEEVLEENRHLRFLVTQNALQMNALSEARRENQRLREFLGFEPPEHFRLVPVKIVTLLHDVHPVAAVINKGGDVSIQKNQPVINRFGLVGKIKEVMPEFATVSLITDPSNAVSGRIAESRQIGIVRFSPAVGMYLDNLPADARVEKGNLIITSGLGGVYPAGLTVAVVDTAFAQKGDIMKNVRLKPAVNFLEIDELYVLVSDVR